MTPEYFFFFFFFFFTFYNQDKIYTFSLCEMVVITFVCTRNQLNNEHMVHNIQRKIYFYPMDYEPAFMILK